jgi:peroxiredoxin
MKKNLLILGLVALAVAALIFTTSQTTKKNVSGQGQSAAQSGPDIRGKQAPEFELKNLEGKTVRLADYRGKAVLINFWATWCGPCKIEMPWFVEFQKQYESQGLEIVGIALDDSSVDTIAKFAKQMNVNYAVLLGKDSVGDAYGGVDGMPTSFYIDRTGKVVEETIGLPSGKAEIETNIKKILGGTEQKSALLSYPETARSAPKADAR